MGSTPLSDGWMGWIHYSGEKGDHTTEEERRCRERSEEVESNVGREGRPEFGTRIELPTRRDTCDSIPRAYRR